jgi:hypothetical protein
MKRAVLYTRVSTFDQNPETQALDLRRLAEQRGFEVVHEYTDRISGAKAKRPALDQMLAAAHRGEFDTVLVWAEWAILSCPCGCGDRIDDAPQLLSGCNLRSRIRNCRVHVHGTSLCGFARSVESNN